MTDTDQLIEDVAEAIFNAEMRAHLQGNLHLRKPNYNVLLTKKGYDEMAVAAINAVIPVLSKDNASGHAATERIRLAKLAETGNQIPHLDQQSHEDVAAWIRAQVPVADPETTGQGGEE